MLLVRIINYLNLHKLDLIKLFYTMIYGDGKPSSYAEILLDISEFRIIQFHIVTSMPKSFQYQLTFTELLHLFADINNQNIQ